MLLTLGFSPCPNDTFIFDALVNGKIDTKGLEFDVQLEDVQTLNEWALSGKLAISKISYGVWPLVQHQYSLLESGGALGKGVGPLLIAKNPIVNLSEVDQMNIAVPGINTTAHMLFSMAFPKAKQKQFMVFHEIEQAVLDGKVDAGVIIHENRFTYQDKGLVKLMDLGENWEQNLQCPIPLGGIVMRNDFEPSLRDTVNGLIKSSVEYGFANYPTLAPFVRQHAQEMSEAVMRQHIDLYVNGFSIELGSNGHKAVAALCNVYKTIHGKTSKED
jgi:1,4-dihydroxy-6-naphthoate synthase